MISIEALSKIQQTLTNGAMQTNDTLAENPTDTATLVLAIQMGSYSVVYSQIAICQRLDAICECLEKQATSKI